MQSYTDPREALEAAGLRESVLGGWLPAHCAIAPTKNGATRVVAM
jgi:hypothetical protein